MSFRYLDMEHYERIEHFRYFLSMPYPYAGVTVDIDVTDIVSFLSLIHILRKVYKKIGFVQI